MFLGALRGRGVVVSVILVTGVVAVGVVGAGGGAAVPWRAV